MIETFKCSYCNKETHRRKHNQKYCSVSCRDKVYYADKKEAKEKKLIAYIGELMCSRCGYKKESLAYFDFHHRDRNEKEAGAITILLNNSWERAKEEIDKCDLLCPTCHREVHIEQSGRSNR